VTLLYYVNTEKKLEKLQSARLQVEFFPNTKLRRTHMYVCVCVCVCVCMYVGMYVWKYIYMVLICN